MKRNPLLLILLCALSAVCYPQPANFYPRGIGGGGALFFPSINPANDNEFYVSCDMSELFHTTDFGLNYSQVISQNSRSSIPPLTNSQMTPILRIAISMMATKDTL